MVIRVCAAFEFSAMLYSIGRCNPSWITLGWGKACEFYPKWLNHNYMKTYRLVTKTGVLMVKAETATVGDGNKIIFFWEGETVVAAFNVDEIVGFVQVDYIG